MAPGGDFQVAAISDEIVIFELKVFDRLSLPFF